MLLLKGLSCVAVSFVLLLVGAVACPTAQRVLADSAVTTRFSAHTPNSAVVVDHRAWDAILKAHVVTGADGVNRMAFRRLKGEPAAAVKNYIKALEAVDVDKLDRPEQQAFWINLYNAVTLDAVLGRYPVKSIKDARLKDEQGVEQEGPWKAKRVSVGGVGLSLDEIENAIVRAVFKEPRAHYTLNCLSIGCPNLQPFALAGSNLEATYEAAARVFVNHPRAISFGTDGKVTASSVYDWFVADFGGFDGVVAHLKTYAAPELKAKLMGLKAIDGYAYDWVLADLDQQIAH